MKLQSWLIGPSRSFWQTCLMRFGESRCYFARCVLMGDRTPMNGIIGMTELTLDSDLNRSQRESLLLVHSLARSLLLIIDDILDISKSTLSFSFPSPSPCLHNPTSRSRSHDNGSRLLLPPPNCLRYSQDPCRPRFAAHIRRRARHS